MKGVTIGDKHSYNDYGLFLKRKIIYPPEVQTKLIDIPMRDGSIDLTESLTGKVKFGNRQIEMSFIFLGDFDNIWLKISDIANDIHGKRLKVVFDEDSSYYYIGRWEIDSPSIDRKAGTFSIIGVCEPYKYDGTYDDSGDWLWNPFDFETGYVSDRHFTVDGTYTATIGGSDKEVIPTIKSSAEMTVSYKGKVYQIAEGSNKLYDIVISTNPVELVFEGSGEILITYEGGIL
jgi:hypothetical protein